MLHRMESTNELSRCELDYRFDGGIQSVFLKFVKISVVSWRLSGGHFVVFVRGSHAKFRQTANGEIQCGIDGH